MTTIDVHSHIMPDIYLDALKAANARNVDGYPPPEWSLKDHLKMMDDHKIQACVLSVSSPGLSFADSETAANLARAINIQFADIIRNHPARFGAFALLPLPNIEAALREIEYSLDVLKLDGVGLYTNYEGAYLGDPKFAPILDELHKRKAVVFVHPTTPPHSEELTLGYPAPMLEYPFDSTRMVLSLLDTNTIERCNHIRFIISHGGGTLPLLTPRIGPLMQIKKGGNKLSALVDIMRTEREIGHLFFDLTAATHPAFLAALKECHEPAKLLAGFDFPFMPTQSINRAKDGIESFEGFSDKDKADMDAENARKLFPRLAGAIQQAS
jgi:predicted TIM-barrel fold metal-dependent hydrolase